MHIVIMFGGRSAEHEISLLSADFIAQTLAKKHTIHPVYITRDGLWFYLPDAHLKDRIKEAHKSLPNNSRPVILWQDSGRGVILDRLNHQALAPVDCVFPALHGPYGEDGTIQGFLEILDIPYAGASVLGSAIGMDKATTKYLLKAHQLPTVPFVVIESREWELKSDAILDHIKRELHPPFFVKPSNLGSSIGISRVDHTDQLLPAIQNAFQFDHTILVEQGLSPVREVECSVLDGSPPRTSVVGEITYARSFYDYEAKYVDARTELHIPADIPESMAQRVRELASATFLALRCSGMARVDFFIHKSEVYINEINTIPGFTPYSMYHRLWSATGLPPDELLEELLRLALERHHKKKTLKIKP